MGSDGNIIHSPDWGENWQMQECGADCELWDVFFINDAEGWAVGGGIGLPGVLLHTTTGGLVGISDNIAGLFSLEQNKPNPFRKATEITFEVGQPAHVHVGVFNILGQEVATLTDEFKTAGTYHAVFEPQCEDNGIYYCELQVDGRAVVTRKMVLVR